MTDRKKIFTERLARAPARSNGHSPGWLRGLRHSAFQWALERGYPTVKDEAWKYMRVAPILEVPFEPAEPGTNRRSSEKTIDELAPDLGGPRLVFINGFFAPELSSLKWLPEGTQVTSLRAELAEGNESLELLLSRPFREHPQAFTALNTALAEDGAFVRVPASATPSEPIHLVFISATGPTPLASHPRVVVLAGAGSRATIVETHAGTVGDVYLTNAVSEVVLDEGATVEHYKVQTEAETAFHVALLSVWQGRDSRFSAHSVALGSSIARQEVRVGLEAPGAEVFLNGLYMPRGQQHLDNPTTIDHAASQCTSRELYKGIVDGQGRGSFDGRIVVRPGALGTDASQTNKNLLLSESAQAFTRPRLEIFADDVKCAHGAAVGELDQDAVFYLRSRGIREDAARGLLTYGFAGEMLGLIRVEPLRSHVESLVARRLGTDGGRMAA